MSSTSTPTNVAHRLRDIAAQMPDAVAVARPGGGDAAGKNSYATCTFRALDSNADALARGLLEVGVQSGDRLALLVPPGIEFVTLVFALLRSGATVVLIDPGMGISRLLGCLAKLSVDGFVAGPLVHVVRRILGRRFSSARMNVNVGPRWLPGTSTYHRLLKRGQTSSQALPETMADDPAAIIFTSGSTGPPKGVLYTHQMFEAQAAEISGQYELRPGGADLSCFPLFGLFNSAMGVTTVFPEMDFSRPATCDPRKLLAAADDWRVTQAFASPAVWDRVSRACEKSGQRIPSLRKVLSCGAPVPAVVLERTLAAVAPNAEMHTPYGATESLPVATIAAAEVLEETRTATDRGAGVCVGRKFPAIEWRVIRISDEPIATVDEVQPLDSGEIGELIVRAPQVSPAYIDAPAANAGAKIDDHGTIWHRIGDVGYLDDQERFWYCGRKSHRVVTAAATLFTIPIEARMNAHPAVCRSALVGVGPLGAQIAVVVVEIERSWPGTFQEVRDDLCNTLSSGTDAAEVGEIIRYAGPLPVDVRHNAKINREQLSVWAEEKLRRRSRS